MAPCAEAVHLLPVVHASLHACAFAHIHLRVHVHTVTHTACMHAAAPKHSHPHTHTHTCTHTHAHARTHTHTHMTMRPPGHAGGLVAARPSRGAGAHDEPALHARPGPVALQQHQPPGAAPACGREPAATLGEWLRPSALAAARKGVSGRQNVARKVARFVGGDVAGGAPCRAPPGCAHPPLQVVREQEG